MSDDIKRLAERLDSETIGQPVRIVDDGDTIREIPCLTGRVSRSQPSTTGAVGSVESPDRETQ